MSPAPTTARAPRRDGTQPPPRALPPFDRVVDEHGPAVLRFCVARAGQGGEDVFQETMIAALRAYSDLRDPEAVLGWLFSIAHRKVIDAARATTRRPVAVGGTQELESAGSAGSSGTAAALGPGGPEANGSQSPAIWIAVRTLPAKQRTAVTLRYLADLTHAEIADVMEISEVAVRRNVFEGLRRLREDGDLTDFARGSSNGHDHD